MTKLSVPKLVRASLMRYRLIKPINIDHANLENLGSLELDYYIMKIDKRKEF